MTNKQEQFNELQKKNIEAAMQLAQLSIENSKRIMEVQVNAAKTLFEDGVESAKAQSATKNPQDLMQLRAQYAQHTTERMLACAREIAEITASTQAAFGKLVGEQLSSGSQDMFDAMQKMFSGMPITDNNAMGAMQSAMDTTRSAFEQMARASSEAFAAFSAQAQGRK